MIIFSDLHLRESSEEICFKILDQIEQLALKHGNKIVFCGDFWHIRYQISVRLLNRVAKIMDRWKTLGIKLDLLPGNHDQVDIAGQNALEVFEAFGHKVWTEPAVDYFGWIPYRKDFDEQRNTLVEVRNLMPADSVIFGHFGIAGATMNNGHIDSDGQPNLGGKEIAVDRRNRQYLVLGHYHKAQIQKYYRYVGSPYQTSYGEAGNNCGCLNYINGKFEFIPLEVGAPKHYILQWNLEENKIPRWPGKPHDHVRLDIKAAHEQITAGKFRKVLATHGLENAQIRVIPQEIKRDHKFEVQGGESLFDAAARFANERMEGNIEQFEIAMAALKRWV